MVPPAVTCVACVLPTFAVPSTAAVAVLLVTASFPFYVYAAYIMIEADPVTWADLKRHVGYISVGLALNTAPVVGWMIPRLLRGFGGLSTLHAFLGLQAYAFLAVAVSGVWKIYRAKRTHDQYADPATDVELTALDPQKMSAWRGRLRVGVVGWMVLWVLAYLTGLALYVPRLGV